MNFLEKTIISISDENGERMIKFLGYGYFSEGSEPPQCFRLLEYCFFEAPLNEVLAVGTAEYESEHSDRYKQYITDCTEEELQSFISHYDNGNAPVPLPASELNAFTPNGTYILL